MASVSKVKNYKTHVVIQTAFIGDVFLSIPFLLFLRRLYPSDRIVFVAKKGVADYFVQENLIDELITISKGDSSSYKTALQHLDQFDIENVFCIHRSLRSALFALRIKARQKFGFRGGLNALFFNRSIKYPSTYPDAVRQMALLSLVDQDFKTMYDSKDWSYLNYYDSNGSFPIIPDVFSMPKVRRVELQQPFKLAVFPGSVWPTKKWPIENFVDLADKLVRLGYDVHVMGGPEERALADRIAEKVPQVKILAGEMKLVDSINFLKSCRLIIANDSSPSHLGAAVGTPVLTIFGPTTLGLGFRPWNNESHVVENRNLSCRPCGLHGHKKCPLEHHKCMKDISVSQVLKLAQNLLSS